MKTRRSLCDAWLYQGDFLLAEFEPAFTHVVGNPPYVRQEAIPDILMAEYRMRYKTIYDRADIYVPFIERSLALLAQGGKLGFHLCRPLDEKQVRQKAPRACQQELRAHNIRGYVRR